MYLVNALNVIDEVKKAVIGKDSCVEIFDISGCVIVWFPTICPSASILFISS